MLKVNVRTDCSGHWLEQSILHLVEEAASDRAGSDAMLAKLSEALFVDTLRRYVTSLPDQTTGGSRVHETQWWVKSLALLHRRAHHAWTLAELAADVGVSRSCAGGAFHALPVGSADGLPDRLAIASGCQGADGGRRRASRISPPPWATSLKRRSIAPSSASSACPRRVSTAEQESCELTRSGKPALMRLVFVSRERNRRAAREPWLEEMSLTPGAQCGGYEIVGLLGTGGMGEVYRARDLKLGRQVAIKVLGVEALANPGAVRRFQHEARAASALNHPGIVTIHDVGELDGQFFIVMELVEGSTLRQLLGRGRAPLKKTLQIASQMADALAKAHEAGIVHCDLKPENAMLTDEGHVKIVDFGLAKLTDPAASAPAAADGPDGDRTTERIVFGTVGYMSPEQATGGTADFRADQFAFGAILYEMATGSRAFHKDTGAETLSMIIRGEPERPLDLNPSLPLPLVWIIERCLSKDPADRYVSTRDLARDVQTLREHTTHRNALEVPRLATRIRRPWVVAAVAAVTALALSVAGTLVYFAMRAGPGSAPGNASAPSFQQLTFGRGLIQNARFAPDGQTIIYAAGWGDGPMQLFETRPSGPESRPIGPPGAGLASISSKGEIALIQNCQLDWGSCVGTLATMPLGGDAPRDVLEDVVSADWTPDGAAARRHPDHRGRVPAPVPDRQTAL